MGGETILVADDEERVREMIGASLEEAGYRTVLASDGAQAMTAISQRRPDLVLADVNMPNLNGLQLARELRSDPHTAGIPILMLSALAQPREILSGYAAGTDEYVTKPVELAVLLARIEALLARRPHLEATPPAGKTLVFLHAKGGVGTTTVATNVAVTLCSSLGPARVCLFDQAALFGSAASLLGLVPAGSLVEALASQGDLDGAAFDDLLLMHATGVRLLAGCARGDESLPEAAVIRGVLDRLRQRFDYVLVDAPMGLSSPTAALVRAADLTCVVSSAGRASTEAAGDLLRLLDDLPLPAARQALVVNRLAAGLELGQVVQSLQREPVAIMTPSDLYPAAADSGEPVVTAYRGHRAAVELEELAGRLKGALDAQAQAAVAVG
jgi:CheY-like chemotaxis protein/MinD-like ATPase involved in chromosome partitioning or flagellar assembly